MSSFLLFLRLSTAFEFDETFPARSRASFHAPLFLSFFLPPFTPRTPFSFFRFLFIHIVGVTRAIQRNLVCPCRLFPSVAARNCRFRDSLESRKNASVLPSILQHHFSRSGYNSAEHLPSGFHCSPFFRIAPSISLHRKQFVLKPFPPHVSLVSNFIQRPQGRMGDTSGTKGNNF